MSNKPDWKQMNKTQRALVFSLLSLLETRDFAKITVNDLCGEALVSRSSFYVHFQDKYDLLRFSLTELRNQMEPQREGKSPEELALQLVHNVQEHANVLMHLASDSANDELRTMLGKLMAESFSHMIAGNRAVEESGVPLELYGVFYSTGLTGLLFWWIHSRFSTPKEELAKYISQLMRRL